MMTACCVCGKVKAGNVWLEAPPLGGPVSHGHCPDCYKIVSGEIDELIRQNEAEEAAAATERRD